MRKQADLFPGTGRDFHAETRGWNAAASFLVTLQLLVFQIPLSQNRDTLLRDMR